MKAVWRSDFFNLYGAAFFQGLVFWYAVEKLFMQSIGLSDFEIGVAVAAVSVTIVLAEFPSGVLADKWSRTGALKIATLLLMLSSLVGGLSDSFIVYVIASMLWGAFFAIHSGLYEALSYDMLLERKIGPEEFDHVYGMTKVADGVALVTGSVLGGLLADITNLRATYFVTILSVMFALFFLNRIKEPKIHKTTTQPKFIEHTKATLKLMDHHISLVLLAAALIVINILFAMTFEFSQLYYIAIGLPIALFGISYATIVGTIGLSGKVASKLKSYSYKPFIFILLGLPVLAFGQFIVHTPAGFILPSLLALSFIVVTIRFTRYVNQEIPSSHRASFASAINTFGRMVGILPIVVFGGLIQDKGYFNASLLVTFVALMAAILGLLAIKFHKQRVSP